jgi:hypothetical protein
MQASSLIAFALFCSFDLLSMYNHKATRGKPIAKKMIVVLIGICKTNREIPKQTVPIPRIKIHCVVISSCNFHL